MAFLLSKPVVFLMPAISFLCILNGAIADQQACSDGWFGPECNVQCHCAGASSCSSDGSCGNGTCEKGYVLEACQQEDLIYINGSNGNSDYIKDKDESKCNTNPNRYWVNVNIYGQVLFSWFNLKIKPGSENLLNFDIKINAISRCENQHRFVASDTEVIVTCSPVYGYVIEVRGPIVPDLCGLVWGGGRNVALKRPTNHTSQLSDNTVSSNAVDGNGDSDISKGSCEHTSLSQSGDVMWLVKLDKEMIIYKIIIRNLNNNLDRLKFFKLDFLRESGELTWHYDHVDTVLYEIFITPSITQKTMYIRLSLSPRNDARQRILAMCEFEVYAEPDCPDGMYGLFCDKNCTCKSDRVCHVLTGLCSAKCYLTPEGNMVCERDCAPNCISCNTTKGKCMQCSDGYNMTDCTECSAGFYGTNCSQRCSPYCADTCNPINGTCTCFENFYGWNCSQKDSNLLLFALFPLLLLIIGAGFLIAMKKTHNEEPEDKKQVAQ